MRTRFHLPTLLAAALLFTTSAAAWADPPARVGRISYLQGDVAFHSAEQSQWTPAVFNYPVTSGDSFWAPQGARTEIQVGASEIRIDQATELDIIRMDDEATQLSVPQGVINIHLHTPPAAPVQVVTPQGAIYLMQVGSYHIETARPGAPPASSITVLEGSAQVQGPSSPLNIAAGEHATLSGYPASITLDEAVPTSFDNWALTRERRETEPATAHYVSMETTGIADLDSYGQWASTPSYGAVWYPTAVPAGWAPYRYGHWAYVSPWGWTWVDEAPWGFAPFHYGRWAHINGRWGWRVAHPVYAPALVAFAGSPGRHRSHDHAPAAGWVPLAPHEKFHPYYRTSEHYTQNINAHDKDVKTTQYANSTAFTATPHVEPTKDAPHHGNWTHTQPPQANSPDDLDHVTARHLHFKDMPRVYHETQMPSPPSAPVVAPQGEHEHRDHEHREIHPAIPIIAPARPIPPTVREPQVIRHEAQEIHTAQPAPQPRPVEITHPVQHSRMEATPQGWQRMPQEQHPHPQEQQRKSEPHPPSQRDTNDNRGHP